MDAIRRITYYRESWLVALLLFGCTFAATARTVDAKKSDGDDAPSKGQLSFLVVGDWGRYGSPAQRSVAAQMGQTAASINAKFILSTGDNFYPNGVASIDDPQWQTSFEQVYTDFSLHNDWYVVLGNHDYHGNPQAEIDYTKRSERWHMPARYYTMTKPVGAHDSVEFFFVDTSPFIDDYKAEPDHYALAGQNPDIELAWLADELAKSRARWKFVVGHHHIYSGGKRATQVELERSLVPLMSKYGVQAYICGHEHDLQVIRRPNGKITYLVSGAGSEHRPTGNTDGTLFSASDYGFVALTLIPDNLHVSVINGAGKILFATDIGP